MALQQKIGELEAANALLAETSERNIYSWKQIHDRIMGMYETVSEALNCKDLGLTEHGIRVLIGRMNAAEDHVKILEAKVKKLTTPPAKREYHVGINRVEKTLECYVRNPARWRATARTAQSESVGPSRYRQVLQLRLVQGGVQP